MSLNKIVQNLIDLTKDNVIEWKLSNNLFNNDTTHYYETWSIDKLTRFVTEIKLDESFNYKKSGNSLQIHNKNLVNGTSYVYPDDVSEIYELQKLIFTNYISKVLPVKNNKTTYDDILGSMGTKQYIRDKKIDTILGDTFLGKLFNKK